MIGWYFNRLRTISILEFPYRIRQFIHNNYEKFFCIGKFPRNLTFSTKGHFPAIKFIPDKLYPDSISIYGNEFRYTEYHINWQQDIISGQSYPLSYSKAINIRGNSNLSAKVVWEVNRLQFLPLIALNYRRTGNSVYLNQLIGIINSWIDGNPYLVGINWYSNIEINIRLIVFFLCWQLLDADELTNKNPVFKEFVVTRWIPSIYQHCRYSHSNPSKYSSSNNHLISEYTGLFIASSLWQFKESESWNRYSKKGLEKEIQRQHSANGINREEAAGYIQFITDFFLIALIVGEDTNNPFSNNYKNKLKKILYYIHSFIDMNGHFPKYGDEDDGKCLFFDTDEKFNNFRSLLTSGAILFNDPVLKTKSDGFDIKSHILFGESGKLIYESIPEISYKENSKFYHNEGHFIFRKYDNGKEIYLHFDAAPLGFLSIAAHGHADALSFTLHIDGHPVFIDPGTYTYHTEPEWRQYFIGTLAHNTICIDLKNQAINGGPTLWIRHYKSRIINYGSDEVAEWVKASHNGYNKEKVEHIREIRFNRDLNEFQILDKIILKKNRLIQVEIPFHVHPNIKITSTAPNFYCLSGSNTRITEFYVDQKLVPEIIKGQTQPKILGWYSDSFLKKEATNVIYCKTYIENTTFFKFNIKIT